MSLSIQDEVKQLAQQVARDPAQPVLPDGIGETEIHGFESRTGLGVPNSLREWLKFTNGPRIGIGGVQGIRTPNTFDDIEDKYQSAMHPQWATGGWIPVANDGCGNYYVLATHKDDGPGNPVLFIECVLDTTEPAYVVASDFWHFLRFDFRADLGERGWPFDRDKVLAEDPALAHYSTVPPGLGGRRLVVGQDLSWKEGKGRGSLPGQVLAYELSRYANGENDGGP